MVELRQCLIRILTKLIAIISRLSEEVDYIIEQGSDGKWSYTKWKNGKIEIRYSGYLTFTSGYVTVRMPKSWGILTTVDTLKAPIAFAAERYIGDKRSSDIVLNCAQIASDDNTFTIYGRGSGAAIAGSYYVDILVNGYYK